MIIENKVYITVINQNEHLLQNEYMWPKTDGYNNIYTFLKNQ